ncbi:MAG: MATE family efflux transporter [Clostridia bacterium]|nr:MATE family efflux transporter [Clostridia bacterium]
MAESVLKRNSTTINKKYTEYFLPTVLTAMATNIAFIIDSIIAGNILGKNALSAISLLSPIAQLYFSLTIMFGLGASSIIAVAKGKNDNKKVNKIFTSTFLAVVVLCIVLIAVQLVCADGICTLLTKDSVLHSMLYDYYIPFIIGTPLNLLLLCSIYFIRTDNRPKFASNIIIISSAVNLIMDYVFMGMLNMGIGGSAWATVTGNFVGFIIMITHFISKKSTFHFDFSILKTPKDFFAILANLVTVGLSGALGTLLITVKMFFLNFLIQSVGGSDAMASYSICSSSQIFMSMFITGAAQTMIPIIGVCLGEKDYDGIRYAFRRAAKILAISSGIIMLFICVAPEPVIRLFGITAENDIANAIPAMRINSLSFPPLAFSFLLLYYYMATQRKALSTTIAVLNGIVILIPSALILSKIFGITGVWISFVVAQVGTLVIIYIITLVLRKKSKGKYDSFYLLETNDKNEIISLSFKGTKENASGVSLYLTAFLTSHGVEKNKANRIAVAVEGISSDIAQRTEKTKKADIDIRVMIDKDETIISIRENGKPFDYTFTKKDEDTISDIKVVKSISKSIEYSNVLGFNRLIIKI